MRTKRIREEKPRPRRRQRDADELLAAYEAGDAQRAVNELSAFDHALADGLEKGEISADAAAAIEEAKLGLLLALRREDALVDVDPARPPAEEDAGGGGRGNDDEGPPPHAEGHGNGDD